MNINRNAYAPLENPIPSYRRTDKAIEQGFDNANLSNNNTLSNKQNLYNSIETIEAQIIDITEYQVILKCLLDPKTRSFQTRKFDKIPFEGLVDLKPNNFVKITIYTRPGERKFVYQNMYASDELKELFEPEDLSYLFDSSFFTPINTTVENNVGVAISSMTLKQNTNETSFTFQTVLSDDLNKVHHAVITLTPIDLSGTDILGSDASPNTYMVTKVASKILVNNVVTFLDATKVTYYTYQVVIALYDLNNVVIDKFVVNVIAEE